MVEQNNINRFKILQQARDRMIDIYDEARFNYQHISYETFKKIKDMKDQLDVIADSYISDMSSVQKIVVTEEAIIEPGKVCELHTNITHIPATEEDVEINFEGYIPTSGYLKLTSKESEIGLRIYVENTVNRNVYESYTEGYHYCDPTTTKYFDAGVYQIKKGTVIGTAITKTKEKPHVNTKTAFK